VDPAGQAPGQRRYESVTRGGVRVTRTVEPFPADDIDQVCARLAQAAYRFERKTALVIGNERLGLTEGANVFIYPKNTRVFLPEYEI